jgi:hypothetical protein
VNALAPDQHRPACTGYSISQSSGSAACAIHGYLPLICPCSDYSPDFDANGYRATRWEALMRQAYQQMPQGH